MKRKSELFLIADSMCVVCILLVAAVITVK